MDRETEREAMSVEGEEAQARVDIWKYVFGFTEMAVVKCSIELGIADVLESNTESPMTLSELSSSLGCSPSALHRIMRFLTRRGIFKEKSTGQGSIGYVQTPLSRLLMRHGGDSMAPLVLLESSPMMLASWQRLSSGVLANGTSAFEAVHGENLWHHTAANPGHSKFMNDAMACDARLAVPAIISGCPEIFKGVGSLVDVGGGTGTTLGLLVKAFPWIRGINFDLPHVVSVAPHFEGVNHMGGNMFDSIPEADATFFKWVLHDWGDDECIHILKRCKEAIPQDTGKVIIVEVVIEEKEGDVLKDVGLMLDMALMAHTNKGKERTLKEWAFVLSEAGFKRYTVKHIQAVQSVIEAYP